MALIATMFRRLVWLRKEKVELDLKNSSHSFFIASKESKKLRFILASNNLRSRIRAMRSQIDEAVVFAGANPCGAFPHRRSGRSQIDEAS